MSLIVRFYLVDLKLHATLRVRLPASAEPTLQKQTLHICGPSTPVDFLLETSRAFASLPD